MQQNVIKMQVLKIKTMFLEIQNMSCENDDEKYSKR